ncbi:hypothetical protein J2T09_003006 [Neorhizobium huautlense]|uniref:Uncharacterized protein n=1 Tax=Neorhizobium huautlense TaxID=67774 RepID=A0ABT9PWV4_9HYPH|nr:hypothetical protein [Neorhizobium huautlense]MDP9838239.1 hypothetical protein [Neorhizobium huautlense]
MSPGDCYDTGVVPLPRRWDFVWCAFPHVDKPFAPGPYYRPCIVRKAGYRELGKTGTNIPWVSILYCTKQLDRLDEYSFIIDDPDHLKECGLRLETLVVTNRTSGLPWMALFFDRRKSDNKGPVIGVLPDVLRAKVLALRPDF